MTLLIDIGDLPAAHADCCLNDLFKALAEDPLGKPESIWTPHENPLIRNHVEDVTARFQQILLTLQNILARALLGEDLPELRKADPPWERWDQAAFERTQAQLASKPSSTYTLQDWMLLVDFLMQKYLGPDVIQSEAEYLTVRATLAGMVQAEMQRPPSNRPEVAIAAIDALPTALGGVPERVLTPLEHSMLLIAKEYAATNIGSVTEKARARMRTIIVEHFQAQLLGQKEGTAERTRQHLFDEFGVLNRDFRRIAVTEAGECVNFGFIAAQKPGTRVKRQEAYRGACPFCKAVNGKVFTVVSPAAPQKDGETEVWVGKSNLGRSASPRRRGPAGLEPREPEEMWWQAAGVNHPHCRGSWLPVSEPDELAPGASPEFAKWLDELIAEKLGDPEP